MGCDKAWLRLGPTSLIERVLEATAPLDAHRMLIADDIDAFAPLGLPVHPDLHPGSGPLGGLHTALVHAPTSTLLLLACDLPFVTPGFLHFLAEELETHQAAVPRSSDGLQPLCAAYDRACRGPVERALARGDLRITSFFPEVDLHILPPSRWRAFDPDGILFTNLNTPEEYRRALERVQRETPLKDRQ